MEASAKAVSEALTRMTGAPFVLSELGPDSPIARRNPKWYILCPDADFSAKVAHVKEAWADDHGNLRIESTELGNTTDWIEQAYGEEGAHKSVDTDYSGPVKEVFQIIADSFPLVRQRLREIERKLALVSDKTGVRLELALDGSDGLAWFKIGAAVTLELDWTSNERSIEAAVGALKEAYDAVMELGSRKS